MATDTHLPLNHLPTEDSLKTAKELFAGTVAGWTQVLTGQPFDTVKVRLQTQPRENPTYTGMGDCVRQTLKNEGFTGFYKGTLTPLLGVGACVAIQFGALEYAKRSFTLYNSSHSSHPSHLSFPQLFLSGAFSGLANSILSGPIEHIRTRLQVQSKNPTPGTVMYTGPWDVTRKIYTTHGLRGLYKAQHVTLIREFVGYGAYFATYEYLMQREMINHNKKRSEVEMWKQCAYGAGSGYALWLSVYPVDVVKSMLQVDGFGKEAKWRGMWDCARRTIAQEGVRGLYRGFGPCMLRAAPVNAATFVAYEATMNLLGR
ncbi:mitochondrial carrier domain-containing protein [Fimicolochytrium jonesii]|uniref:mitochondrial carrier domain-containing protein n=1 Tax=Fimicolochytrium jonesii TaxID=1396493 RepID=UPI0022FED51F|nr:mitochondrial carrier domain-containing protein [Fimicolochytrium jonesii]KAI8826827.1 mitochondrial carrier domain-containing protein [Fimicolochytrium jonesii]